MNVEVSSSIDKQSGVSDEFVTELDTELTNIKLWTLFPNGFK